MQQSVSLITLGVSDYEKAKCVLCGARVETCARDRGDPRGHG